MKKKELPGLRVEVGTLVCDKEFPEDMGMVVDRDEERRVYKILAMSYPNVPTGWYRADYVQEDCLHIGDIPEYIAIYNKRLGEMDELEKIDREYWMNGEDHESKYTRDHGAPTSPSWRPVRVNTPLGKEKGE